MLLQKKILKLEKRNSFFHYIQRIIFLKAFGLMFPKEKAENKGNDLALEPKQTSSLYDPKKLTTVDKLDDELGTMKQLEFVTTSRLSESTRISEVTKTMEGEKVMENNNITKAKSTKAMSVKVDATATPKKRVVFISINSLNVSFFQIPEDVLENSIFCFAIAKAHLFPKTEDEKEQALESVVSRMNLHPNVLQSIKDKDEKGLSFAKLALFHKKKKKKLCAYINKIILVYWNYIFKIQKVIWFDLSTVSWQDISARLCQIHDPVTNKNYNPLILDENWWLHKHNNNELHSFSRSQVTAQDIINEIQKPKLKFTPSIEVSFLCVRVCVYVG
ncbi:hypothetical protein RFI_02919 [Reticulomyxa filosa]|uniref:Uncharacterized protein n=1 Tax=Reticulomyxa filosa TaxID=46433 RepID=X6P7X8_RETFI|nr:hypothetical protein RFI_02919 [Reticulomyxa filosa]|eukprot:ETO34174.1 hypothetical protein RFI_02919 [Reticulomyxa filosa]